MIKLKDKELNKAIKQEFKRQQENIELIASENFASEEVMRIQGTIMTNKYAEGYPNKRYYGGCKHVDTAESLAIERMKKLFKAEHANVQPHSGSQANMAVYFTCLEPGDTVLGMDLNAGGHLTHGHPLNFSGKLFNFVSYGVDKKTEKIDYDEVLKIAKKTKPKLLVAGASAYSRKIDFKKLGAIAKEVGAYFMVDMAHIAGLIAAGEHQSPVPYADFVTTTTHKTLRGPRGGAVLCKQEWAEKLDKTVFPGMQGGPLMHVIAAKAQCFAEALTEEYKDYVKQVVVNCKIMTKTLEARGFKAVSGGTDNHLVMINVKNTTGLTGKQAEHMLDEVNITCNKNSVPFDTEKPFHTSGIRLGTAAMTTRGFKEAEFIEVANIIADALWGHGDKAIQKECKARVKALTAKFPLYKGRKVE